MDRSGVLFDATHPIYPLGALGFIVPAMFIAGGLAIVRFPRLNARRDVSVNRAMAVLAVLFGSAMLIGSTIPFFTALRAQAILRSGHAEIVEGCVQHYRKQIGSHNVIDTYFSVHAIPFHFNSSAWSPGFHYADDLIRPGQRLKITRGGDFVIRVEASPGACLSRAENHPLRSLNTSSHRT